MNSIKKLFKSIPFSSYFKRIDPSISQLLSLKKVKVIPVIITFRRPLEPQTESSLKRMGFKTKYHLPFLNAITGKIHVSNFDSISSVVEISKIYFDGIACLMGSTENKETPVKINEKTSLHLSGKGISVAFIDSGIYPHPDLVKPRNRIVAFKDYINELEEPYDDNGHGTACIGAAFGASLDGKFKTAAYDSNLICAKAFDSLGYGHFSDILAAMQWICSIREKNNLKVLVLPFGRLEVNNRFDVLSLAAERLWKDGLFVCTCSGNLGPYEASITSPGICSSSFTTGACTTSVASPQVSRFSGRGPVKDKVDKPDAVMPGYKVATLNSDTGYIPRSKSYIKANLPGQHYAEISGTSVAASMTAAAAVLLCQKKPGLSPDDIKSVLKRLCTSINELKSAQGAGMIDIKKIEEF
jgi:serine protease AprX